MQEYYKDKQFKILKDGEKYYLESRDTNKVIDEQIVYEMIELCDLINPEILNSALFSQEFIVNDFFAESRIPPLEKLNGGQKVALNI